MKTLILGTNLRGLAEVTRICVDRGDDVYVYDSESPEPPEELRDRVTVLSSTWSAKHLARVDFVVTSPWFAEVSPPLSDVLAADIEVISEVGFGLERIDIPFVSITGTNGKTTVTELVTTMLTASGTRATSAGNVGTPVTGMDVANTDILVLELSSYQLRFLGSSTPIAAGLLNVAPDHLDWHGTFEAYAAAKGRVFVGMETEATLAYNVDDPVVGSLVADATCSLVPCSGFRLPDGGNGIVDGHISINGVLYDPPTDDPSFLLDIVIAGTVAFAAGATIVGVRAAVDSFSPGAHRRQVIPTNDGIVWIDDSKATNPHATSSAVAAHAPVVLLAGGQNKGLDLSSIGELEGVTTLILFGEAGPAIQETTHRSSVLVDSLEQAVDVARGAAASGDTVLLSPGCASFDAFSSYAERGDVFQRLVTRHRGAAA